MDHTTTPTALTTVNERHQCAHFGKWVENVISTSEECDYYVGDGMTGNKPDKLAELKQNEPLV